MPIIDSPECGKCNEGCKECDQDQENLQNSICKVCEDGNNLFKGDCIKDCEIGKNEKCLECKTEEGKNDQCLKCNDGYYLSEINKTICKKNEVENCKLGIESGIFICLYCSEGYYLKNNTCMKHVNLEKMKNVLHVIKHLNLKKIVKHAILDFI